MVGIVPVEQRGREDDRIPKGANPRKRVHRPKERPFITEPLRTERVKREPAAGDRDSLHGIAGAARRDRVGEGQPGHDSHAKFQRRRVGRPARELIRDHAGPARRSDNRERDASQRRAGPDLERSLSLRHRSCRPGAGGRCPRLRGRRRDDDHACEIASPAQATRRVTALSARPAAWRPGSGSRRGRRSPPAGRSSPRAAPGGCARPRSARRSRTGPRPRRRSRAAPSPA